MSETITFSFDRLAARLFGMAAWVTLLPVLSFGQEPERPTTQWILELPDDCASLRAQAPTDDGGFLMSRVVLAGEARGRVTRHGSDGQEIWRHEDASRFLRTAAPLESGSFLLASFTASGEPVVLMELSASGERLWTGSYRAEADVQTTVEHIVGLSGGDWLVSGRSGDRGGYVARFAPRVAAPRWSVLLRDTVQFAVPNAQGELLVYMSERLTGPSRETILKLGADGGELSRAPGFQEDYVHAVATADGSVLVLFEVTSVSPWLYGVGIIAPDGTAEVLLDPGFITSERTDLEYLVPAGPGAAWAVGESTRRSDGDRSYPVLVKIESHPGGARWSRYDFPEWFPASSQLIEGATLTRAGNLIVGVSEPRIVDPRCSKKAIVSVSLPGSVGAFRRGDANADGTVNVTDAVATLQGLFQGGRAPACADGADADDDGRLSLTDAVITLNHLFQSGPALPSPGSEACGVDPTEDDLPSCSAACAQ